MMDEKTIDEGQSVPRLSSIFHRPSSLPDGVIGNTWPFGGHIPGSSPGRVVLDLLLNID
jgi:hypothetical protein